MIKGEPTLEAMLAELEQLVEQSSDGLGLQGLIDGLQATSAMNHDGQNHFFHISRSVAAGTMVTAVTEVVFLLCTNRGS